jgi:hypothetical protein
MSNCDSYKKNVPVGRDADGVVGGLPGLQQVKACGPVARWSARHETQGLAVADRDSVGPAPIETRPGLAFSRGLHMPTQPL